MKRLCIYHNADQDGICSAAIVRKRYPDIELLGMDYGDKVIYFSPEYQEIVMVDFSLPMKNMINLNKRFKLVWIDHHQSAIKEAKQRHFCPEGLRDLSLAGCELTWKYFFPTESIPLAVTYIGRYDVWDFQDSRVVPFHYGMQAQNYTPTSFLWNKLFRPNPVAQTKTTQKLIQLGYNIVRYQQTENRRFLERGAYQVEFEGLQCLALNRKDGISMLTEQVRQNKRVRGLDMFIGYQFTSSHWVISLRSLKKEIDVSEIAKKYGGGGHVAAAGFTCKELPKELLK